MKYYKYSVVIDGYKANWNGFVFAINFKSAFEIASEIANGLGCNSEDVIMCYRMPMDNE